MWHSFVSSVSGKSRLSVSKRFVSFALCVFFIISAFAFSASAADYDFFEFFTVMLQKEVSTGSSTSITNFEYSVQNLGDQYIVYADDISFWDDTGTKFGTFFEIRDMKAGHEYELEFSVGVRFKATYNVRVLLSGNEIYSTTVTSSDKLIDYTISFNAPDVVSSYGEVLTISVELPPNVDWGANPGEATGFRVGKMVAFTDRTDEPGWLGKILQRFTDLGDTIGSFFTSIGDRISGFFSSLWENIKQSFTDLKQWFVDLGNRIQGFFVELYNDIVEGLKKLFIPADGYFDSKKEELETFCVEHFGAMYQVPDMVIDIIEKFTTISPGEPSITVPAIEFDFQGKHYQLTDDISYSFSWVNDSTNALYYFYKFYRGFVTIILFLAFANYCIKKYNEVFAGSDAE